MGGASIGKDDTKSMDVTKAKDNWRYAKDSKFRKICMARLRQLSPKIIVSNIPDGKRIWLRSTSLRLGIPSKICKEAIRQMLRKLGLQCKIIELASTEDAIGAVANLHNS